MSYVCSDGAAGTSYMLYLYINLMYDVFLDFSIFQLAILIPVYGKSAFICMQLTFVCREINFCVCHGDKLNMKVNYYYLFFKMVLY